MQRVVRLLVAREAGERPLTGVFWSYDDQESLGLKGEYVRFHRLGGLMFWELSGDNASGDLFDSLEQSLTAAQLPESDPCAF